MHACMFVKLFEYSAANKMDFQTEHVMLERKISNVSKEQQLFEKHMTGVYENVKMNTAKMEQGEHMNKQNDKLKKKGANIRRKESFNPAIPDFVEDSFSMYQIPLHKMPPIKTNEKSVLRRKNSFDPRIPSFVDDQFGISLDTPTNVADQMWKPNQQQREKTDKLRRKKSIDYAGNAADL